MPHILLRIKVAIKENNWKTVLACLQERKIDAELTQIDSIRVYKYICLLQLPDLIQLFNHLPDDFPPNTLAKMILEVAERLSPEQFETITPVIQRPQIVQSILAQLDAVYTSPLCLPAVQAILTLIDEEQVNNLLTPRSYMHIMRLVWDANGHEVGKVVLAMLPPIESMLQNAEIATELVKEYFRLNISIKFLNVSCLKNKNFLIALKSDPKLVINNFLQYLIPVQPSSQYETPSDVKNDFSNIALGSIYLDFILNALDELCEGDALYDYTIYTTVKQCISDCKYQPSRIVDILQRILNRMQEVQEVESLVNSSQDFNTNEGFGVAASKLKNGDGKAISITKQHIKLHIFCQILESKFSESYGEIYFNSRWFLQWLSSGHELFDQESNPEGYLEWLILIANIYSRLLIGYDWWELDRIIKLIYSVPHVLSTSSVTKLSLIKNVFNKHDNNDNADDNTTSIVTFGQIIELCSNNKFRPIFISFISLLNSLKSSDQSIMSEEIHGKKLCDQFFDVFLEEINNPQETSDRLNDLPTIFFKLLFEYAIEQKYHIFLLKLLNYYIDRFKLYLDQVLSISRTTEYFVSLNWCYLKLIKLRLDMALDKTRLTLEAESIRAENLIMLDEYRSCYDYFQEESVLRQLNLLLDECVIRVENAGNGSQHMLTYPSELAGPIEVCVESSENLDLLSLRPFLNFSYSCILYLKGIFVNSSFNPNMMVRFIDYIARLIDDKTTKREHKIALLRTGLRLIDCVTKVYLGTDAYLKPENKIFFGLLLSMKRALNAGINHLDRLSTLAISGSFFRRGTNDSAQDEMQLFFRERIIPTVTEEPVAFTDIKIECSESEVEILKQQFEFFQKLYNDIRTLMEKLYYDLQTANPILSRGLLMSIIESCQQARLDGLVRIYKMLSENNLTLHWSNLSQFILELTPVSFLSKFDLVHHLRLCKKVLDWIINYRKSLDENAKFKLSYLSCVLLTQKIRQYMIPENEVRLSRLRPIASRLIVGAEKIIANTNKIKADNKELCFKADAVQFRAEQLKISAETLRATCEEIKSRIDAVPEEIIFKIRELKSRAKQLSDNIQTRLFNKTDLSTMLMELSTIYGTMGAFPIADTYYALNRCVEAQCRASISRLNRVFDQAYLSEEITNEERRQFVTNCLSIAKFLYESNNFVTEKDKQNLILCWAHIQNIAGRLNLDLTVPKSSVSAEVASEARQRLEPAAYASSSPTRTQAVTEVIFDMPSPRLG